MTTIEKINATNGSVAAIRGLGLSNDDLVAAASDLSSHDGYHGAVECEPDAVTGEILPVRERVTRLKALATAIVLAQR